MTIYKKTSLKEFVETLTDKDIIIQWNDKTGVFEIDETQLTASQKAHLAKAVRDQGYEKQ